MCLSVVFSFLYFLSIRDLKSPNVLLASVSPSEAPMAKVSDFGLSKQLFGKLAGREVFNPDWLAPEVILDRPHTTAADVYSFGIILWEMISLSHPFSEFDARFRGMPDILKEDAIAKAGLRPTIPANVGEPWYVQLIQDCWDETAEARPSFEEVVEIILRNQPDLIVLDAVSSSSRDGLLGSGRRDHPSQMSIGGIAASAVSAPGRRASAMLSAHVRANGASLALRSSYRAPIPSMQPMLDGFARGSLKLSAAAVTQAVAEGEDSNAASLQLWRCRIARRMVLPARPVCLTPVGSDGTIWIGLASGAAVCASMRTFSSLSEITVCAGVAVKSIVPMGPKKLWLGLQDGSLRSMTVSGVLLDQLASPMAGASSGGTVVTAGGTISGASNLPSPSAPSYGVVWICPTHLVATPGLVVWSDGTVATVKSDLHGLANSVRLKSVPRVAAVDEEGKFAFVGTSDGVISVLSLPTLAEKGSFAAGAEFQSAISALLVTGAVLWVGLEGGQVGLFRLGDGISSLGIRSVHSTGVAAFVQLGNGTVSLGRDGHVCWWSKDELNMEWEDVKALRGTEGGGGGGGGGQGPARLGAPSNESAVAAAVGHDSNGVVICERGRTALTFLRLDEGDGMGAGMVGNAVAPNHPAAGPLSSSQRPGDSSALAVDALLKSADPETRVYVLINQYRSFGTDSDRRRIASIIVEELRAQSVARNVAPGTVPRAAFSAAVASIEKALAKTDQGLPADLLDALAAQIFQRKRTQSLVEATKTAFMDLCAKGLELRALTYDEGLIESFASLVNNYDLAAWEVFPCSVKRQIDRKTVKMQAWSFKGAMFEQHAFTGKTRVEVDVPDYVVLALVSKPEHKLRWERQLIHCETVKQFGPDFAVIYSQFRTPALTLDRDAVLGYLTCQHEDRLVCVARSVPYGQIPLPVNHLRIEVDISGYSIRRLSDKSCEVTMLLQLREIRKANAMLFNHVRRKRMGSLYRLKEYAESLGAEEMRTFSQQHQQQQQQLKQQEQDQTKKAEGTVRMGRQRK